MRDIAHLLYPVLLAGVDLGAGSLLYHHVSAVLGLPMIVVGVLVFCSIAYQILSGGHTVLHKRVQDAVS
jgi:hypothetical protein